MYSLGNFLRLSPLKLQSDSQNPSGAIRPAISVAKMADACLPRGSFLMWNCEKSPAVLRIQCIVYVLFYAILLNTPFWIASRTLGLLLHGWFCLEYALIGTVALFLPRLFSAALVLLAIAVDMLYAVCLTYYIVPFQVLKNIRGLEYFSSLRIGWVVVTALLALCLGGLAMLLSISKASRRTRAKVACTLVAFCLGIVSADFAFALAGTGRVPNLSRGFDDADTVNVAHYADTRVARFPSRWLLLRVFRQHQLERDESSARSQNASYPRASAVGMRLGGIKPIGTQEPNLVLIVVESWGLLTQSAIGDSLVAPYSRADLLARYKVSRGDVPFYGATVAGEARELCGSTLGVAVMEATQKELSGCLPDRLAAIGYHSIAVHGNDGRMFNRNDWYLRIGFEETWFKEELQSENLPNCIGAFTGTCDAAIADWIGSRLKNSDAQPQFIYWMTLNSHLPVPNPAPLSSPASCAFSASLTAQPALCGWFQLVANVHQSVYRLAIKAEERPTVFVIVGDHAPPFADLEIRNDFSHKAVPYIVLTPTGISKVLSSENSRPRKLQDERRKF